MPVAARSDGNRLDVTAWTEAALVLLAEGGIQEVRIELLAKRLNVTKGSFYWHFKDRDALYQSILTHWRRRATVALIERLDQGEKDPGSRLRRLLRLPMLGQRSAIGADTELAIRLWGRADQRARLALQEVDDLRIRYIAQLMMELGISEADAQARAIIAYSYMRVAATLVPVTAQDLMARCEDLLMGSTARSDTGR